MNEQVAHELIAVRKAVKRKYQSLKSDIIQAELDLEKQWKPIVQPLKELVSVAKPATAVETFRQPSSTLFEKDIRQKISSTPIGSPDVLQLETISESEGTPLPETGRSKSPDGSGIYQKQDSGGKEMEQMSESHILGSYLDAFTKPVRKYVEGLIFDKKNEFDTERGINLDLYENNFTMGNKTVEFRGNMFVIFDENGSEIMQYTTTPGLLELLFKNLPNEDVIDEADKKMYQSVLDFTSAHKRYYDPAEQVKGSRGIKYKNIIQPFKTKGKSGKGLLTVNNKRLEFVPWKDPNTLVQRLQVLIASQRAGHTGHDNEIVSIIDALRKAKIIK